MDLESVLALGGIGLLSFALSFVGAAVGLVMGHLRLPLLIAYVGSPVTGAATNLAVSGLGALAGTARHARGGRVSPRALLVMGVPSAVGAVLGVLLFVKVNRFWAHIALGAILVVLGLRMARVRPAGSAGAAGGPAPRPPGGLRLLVEIGYGLLLGALASVSGLMMSSLRLPVMLRTMKLDPRVAVGSNMAIGFLTALVGAVAAYWAGGHLDFLVLAAVGAPTMLGGYMGALLTGRLRKETVQRLLGWTVAALGVLMVAQGCWKATRGRDLQPEPQTNEEWRELDEEDDEWPDWP
jgi:uncharacterized membrane protein YfcA